MSASARDGETHFLFDLDDTLYPSSSGLFRLVSARIHDYIRRTLALDPDEARALQKRYWREYGTSLRGLMVRHGVDPVPFLRDVHDVPVEEWLEPDPDLARALVALGGHRHVFTNGPRPYARRVLARLGVAHLFEEIFDIESFGYVPKPNSDPYDHVSRRLGTARTRIILVDDHPANLRPARERGWITVWLRAPDSWLGGAPGLSLAEGGESADHVIERIADLPRRLEAAGAAGS